MKLEKFNFIIPTYNIQKIKLLKRDIKMKKNLFKK